MPFPKALADLEKKERRKAIRKAVIDVGPYQVREASTGGWRVYAQIRSLHHRAPALEGSATGQCQSGGRTATQGKISLISLNFRNAPLRIFHSTVPDLPLSTGEYEITFLRGAVAKKSKSKSGTRSAAAALIPAPARPPLVIDPFGPTKQTPIKKATIRKSMVVLSDGTRINVRPKINDVRRAVGQFNHVGQPLYFLTLGYDIQTSAPKNLMKKLGAARRRSK